MQKNEEKIGLISANGVGGEGVIKDEGFVVFVPFSIAGEKVKYRVLKVAKNIAYGKLIEVFTPAHERIRPKCPVFTKCGGCQLQHINYANQLKIKEENVASAFKKIAGLEIKVLPTVKGTSEWRYRNKLQLPVREVNGQTIIGFYAENSHRVVQITDCPINAPWTADIIEIFNDFIRQFNVKGYNETTKTGDIKEITVKDVKGNLIITVVVKQKLPYSNELVLILKKKLGHTFSLFVNYNDTDSNVIYGDKFELLHGKPDYVSEMLGLKYKIGVRSFMQVNTSVCSKLYSAVHEACMLDDNTTVIDAYSGAGLMTALLASSSKKAIGIEIIPEAVKCANELAILNGLKEKISNYQGKCEEILPDIIAKETTKNNRICLVLDPPRKGCDINVVKSVIDSAPDRIVYVSCMPSTLARDVGLIVGTLKQTENGIEKVESPFQRYKVEFVRTFDMFAQTKHVEVLVCLTKNV